MIKKEIRDKLFGIIKEKMIPERIEMLKSLEELKKAYVEYVKKNYMTERDLELIKKFPSYVKQVDQIPVARYYHSGIDLVYFNGYHVFIDSNDLCIKFDHPLPSIVDSIVELKDNSEAWKFIGPPFYRYLNLRNRYVKKLNIANEFLSHKNTTITLIKTKFSELYELYRTND